MKQVPRPRIAVDIQFGRDDIRNLRFSGVDVVVQAEHGERDELWLARALAAGVDAVSSPDSDAEIWAYDHRIMFIKVPGHRRCDRVNLVLDAVFPLRHGHKRVYK